MLLVWKYAQVMNTGAYVTRQGNTSAVPLIIGFSEEREPFDRTDARQLSQLLGTFSTFRAPFSFERIISYRHGRKELRRRNFGGCILHTLEHNCKVTLIHGMAICVIALSNLSSRVAVVLTPPVTFPSTNKWKVDTTERQVEH